jgi:hypothetical protein
VESLETRALLSGDGVVDVTQGGNVDLDDGSGWNNGSNDFLYSRQPDWGALTADGAANSVRLDSVFSNFVVTNIAAAVSGSHYRFQLALVVDENGQLGSPLTLDVDSESAVISDDLGRTAEVLVTPKTYSLTIAEGAGHRQMMSLDVTRNRGETAVTIDHEMVDIGPSLDDSPSPTSGGIVDIGPHPSDAPPTIGTFHEEPTQLANQLGDRPTPEPSANSSGQTIVVEGTGGRTQAFELAMLPISQTDRASAQAGAEASVPYASPSVTPTRPVTSWLPGDRGTPSSNGQNGPQTASTHVESHGAVASLAGYEADNSANAVSVANVGTGLRSANADPTHTRTRDGSSFDAGRPHDSPPLLAFHAAPVSRSAQDQQHLAFASEEDWSHGELDWLALNVHQGRQKHTTALIVTALVCLRSLGWHIPFREEKQTFAFPPCERPESG